MLLSLSLSLSLAVLSLAAPDAAAQVSGGNEASFPETCGAGEVGSGGGGEGWIDFGPLPDNDQGYGIIISNALTGAKVWPRGNGPFYVTPALGGLDLTLDTTDNGSTVAYIGTGPTARRLFLPDSYFYVLTFILAANGDQPAKTIHVAWDGAGALDAAGPAYAFYNPAPGDGNIDTCFILDETTREFKISTHDVSTAGAGSGPVNTVLGNVGWTLPYDAFALCPSGGCLTEAQRDGATLNQFISYKAQVQHITGGTFGGGYKLVPDFRFASAVSIPASYPALTWSVPGLVVRFAPDASLATAGVLDVSGAVFTAADASQGWNGVRFEPGSNGAWSGVIVERVTGGLAAQPGGPIFSEPAGEAVRVQDASPTFTGLTIRNPIVGRITNGLAVYGSNAAPVATSLIVSGMTGQGVVASAGAHPALNRGIFNNNAGTAVTALGTGSVVYLAPEDVGNGLRGAQITGNPGGGVAAAASAAVVFSVPIATPGVAPDGFSTVADNAGRGLSATGGGVVYAGGLDQQRKNRIFDNAPGNASGNARASGTSSRVYARCNWWRNETFPFRTTAVSGGLRDVNAPLAEDPYDNPNAECGGTIGPKRAGGASFSAESVAGRSSETALDRLAEAIAAATPAEAASQLASLVADEPDTEEAAAALGEAGALASRSDAPAAAVALLGASVTSPYPALRVAAGQALVASRRAQGDLTGALAAADALAAEGADAHVQAELARVYLYHEAGSEAQAEGALSSLEALAPESVEAALARSFLDTGGEAQRATRGAASLAGALGDAARSAAATAAEATAGEPLLAVWPNPSSGGAAVSLVLAEASDVTVAVYDLLGRVVATPLAGTLAAGEHRATVDAGVLAPGVYVVRASVRAGGVATVQTVRLTVIR